jgi:hypothetical protein
LFTILADKDLDLVPVVTVAERRRRLACDVPALKEDLGEGLLRT